MNLDRLFEQYRDELREWRKAEWLNDREGAMEARVNPDPLVPGDDAMHNALTGLELLFGVGVKEPVSVPWHNLRRAYIERCQTVENTYDELNRMQHRELDLDTIVLGFIAWVDARYYLRERKAD